LQDAASEHQEEKPYDDSFHYLPPSAMTLPSVTFIMPKPRETANAGLQLRRAISIRVEEKKLLEKHAIAPSAARLC
jgi:hypothetical protein